ncbi:sigma-70 family RNA polymerase sigma factor [Kitasatospora sp. GP82]|uniref:sigma-70 family RNA polymerase sigma factor n=1 Tax=Kitasatospora sp. GP82 TaxID=3035089 RepID=UPI002475A301|nr:sigma-70 family RNA polymerase sigma factor [Kitasatospora sp. GP82]MDH6125671.1 RNA polymerase sigma-70 factor (ECF subfamily) [Kitasatospora sp. GP82]
MDDEQLTAVALRARSGRPADIEAFVRATQRDVWRFVAHLTDVQSADDLAQETFLRALRSLPGFAGRSSARTWLLSIARRVVVDRYRSAAARPQCAPLPDWQAAAEQQQRPDEVPRFENEVVLSDLLERVPAQRREAFVLTQVVGLSYAEAAAVTGCPIGTVRSRVARARDELVMLLRSAEGDSTSGGAAADTSAAGGSAQRGGAGTRQGSGRTFWAGRARSPVLTG